MKNQVTLRQDSYSYGKCECCGKRFNRRTRGYVFGLSNGEYFKPFGYYGGDTEKEYNFVNVPKDIKLVKVGHKCAQPIFAEIDKRESDLFETLAQAVKPQKTIKPSKATGEYKVWNEDRTDYHYVIVDNKGGEMVLQRGSEYLEFKIAQQNYEQKIA